MKHFRCCFLGYRILLFFLHILSSGFPHSPGASWGMMSSAKWFLRKKKMQRWGGKNKSPHLLCKVNEGISIDATGQLLVCSCRLLLYLKTWHWKENIQYINFSHGWWGGHGPIELFQPFPTGAQYLSLWSMSPRLIICICWQHLD